MKKTPYLFLLLIAILFVACGYNDMIDKGKQSTMDPRIADINIKQGETNIPDGDTFPLVLVNGVSVRETSEPLLFTIENLGTAELEIIQISIQGDNSTEFILEEPASPYIPAGTNTNFSISFVPEDVESKTATVVIETNDFDEGEYSFVITAISKPVPFFSARLRKGTWPLTVEFKDKSSGTIESYEWDFGDGSAASNEAEPTHTYQEPGTYTVELTLEGPGGVNYQYIADYITVVRAEEHVIDTYADGINSIDTGDINNDGNMDIVGAVNGADEIVWYENDGYGNFSKHIIDNFSNGLSVKAVDIDGDLDIDVLAGGSGGTSWWENDGTGTFSAENNISPTSTTAVSTGNINIPSDSHLDVISVNGNVINLWLNDGTDAFTSSQQVCNNFSGAYSVYAADIDNDNFIDILCAGRGTSGNDYKDGTIAWWENDGTLAGGYFPNGNNEYPAGSKHSIINNLEDARSVYAANLDSGSYIDIIGASYGLDPYYNGVIKIWQNDGSPVNGGWAESTLNNAFYGARHVNSSDLDGDGDMDIIGASMLGGEIAWWENPSEGANTEWIEHVTSIHFSGATSVGAADFNNDNNNDIVGAASYMNELAWWDLLQDGWWYKQSVSTTYAGARFVVAADIDSDGDKDLLGTAAVGDRLTWWENNDIAGPGTGIGRSWTEHSVSDDFHAPIGTWAEDLDGDGYPDVLCAALDDNEIAWMRNNGDGTFASKTPIASGFTGARYVLTEDIDGDSIPDVIGAAETANEIAWWHSNGDGTFGAKNTVDNTFTGVWSFYIKDINGDTYPDIIGAAYGGNEIAWWKNNGDGSFNTLGVPNKISISDGVPFNGAKSVHAEDIDKDGDIDVIGAAQDDDDIAWWENDDISGPGTGNGTSWTKHTIVSDFNQVWSVYLSDLNNDGYMDVIGAAQSENEVAWWENNGDSTFKDKVVLLSNFVAATSAYASDIDGDGDNDVIGTSYWNAEIAWVENNLIDWGL